MKKLLLALTLVSTSVFAQEKDKSDDHKVCAEIEEMARLVITKRYQGVSARTLIEATKGDKATKMIIINAYKKPSYKTEDVINDTINEFADEWYLMCLEARTGKE